MSDACTTPRTEDRFLVETILLSSKDPVPEHEMVRRLPAGVDIHRCLSELSTEYETRSIQIVEAAGGWTVRTRPEHSDFCRDLLPKPPRLSSAALETLSIIAYCQPVTRTEIERVRGVSLAKGTLDLLIWAGYVRPGQRRATPGNPLTFVTTDAFLRQFDLKTLDDLPEVGVLRAAGLLNVEKGLVLTDVTSEVV